MIVEHSDAISNGDAQSAPNDDSKEAERVWNGEATVSDCSHAQILVIAQHVISAHEKMQTHKDALIAFLRHKHVDGKALAQYKKKAFSSEVVAHSDNKKLRGISSKLWKCIM